MIFLGKYIICGREGTKKKKPTRNQGFSVSQSRAMTSNVVEQMLVFCKAKKSQVHVQEIS